MAISILHALLLFQTLASAPVESLLLTGASVLAPDGESWRSETAVLVQDGRIVAVGSTAAMAIPAGVETIDLAGAFLIPGLIDLHTHLCLHPYDEASWDDQVLRESLELRTIRAVTAARATLDAGFTTIRDLGTEGAGWADVALRDAVEMRMIDGPRILATTRAIVATGCYGPAGLDPRWAAPQGAQEASGSEVRRVVREQIRVGADWIKVYADYRRGGSETTTPTFSLAELEELVDEAKSAGVPVCAHATSDEGIRRAVLAGAVTIEHGTGVSEETLALMKERGVALVPTLAASEAMARYGGWSAGEPEPDEVSGSRAMFARALASGVTIACGSDAGVFAHGANARELELMVAYGMQPAQALHSATLVAADVLRRADLGRIEPEAAAALVAVAADPLRDVGALRRPRVVVAAGVVHAR